MTSRGKTNRTLLIRTAWPSDDRIFRPGRSWRELDARRSTANPPSYTTRAKSHSVSNRHI